MRIIVDCLTKSINLGCKLSNVYYVAFSNFYEFIHFQVSGSDPKVMFCVFVLFWWWLHVCVEVGWGCGWSIFHSGASFESISDVFFSRRDRKMKTKQEFGWLLWF